MSITPAEPIEYVFTCDNCGESQTGLAPELGNQGWSSWMPPHCTHKAPNEQQTLCPGCAYAVLRAAAWKGPGPSIAAEPRHLHDWRQVGTTNTDRMHPTRQYKCTSCDATYESGGEL